MIIICFSIAGGSADLFEPMKEFLPNTISVVPFEYAGHGKRIAEPLYHSVTNMADEAYSFIRNTVSSKEEYSLFGYSMGCITLIEVLRRILERREFPKPKHLFVGAHAFDFRDPASRTAVPASDTFLKDYAMNFSGIPTDLANNDYFWKVYLPIYRTDYGILSSYNYRDAALSTDIPTEVFFCESDTPKDKTMLWRYFCPHRISFHEYSGGHFFIKQNYAAICNQILDALQH